MAQASNKVKRLRRKRMNSHDQNESMAEKRQRGVDKIFRFLMRSVKKTQVQSMFAREDKERQKIRKQYPKFARN